MTGADVLVVGAGVSGLACARAAASAGRRVLVVDRARGVGGRCATRRLDGLAFDLGVGFLHGSDADFLAAVRESPGDRIEGWPRVVEGTGRPCQPEAFRPGERRLALVEGVSAFPKHLAEGLSVRTDAPVERLLVGDGGPAVVLGGGEVLRAPAVVVALAAEQSLRLLDGAGGLPRPLAAVRALLADSGSEPSLAVCAVYPAGTPAPAWDAWYPEGSRVLQYLGNESSKRRAPAAPGLVLQAHAGWSRRHLDDPDWPGAVLAEAARLAGDWAARPVATHAHRWRFARSELASELSGPIRVGLPGGGWLGFCGDRFGPGGGVEAAWLSGRELGRRLAAPEVA